MPRVERDQELVVALRDGHYEEEGWRVRKDGTRFWANVLITAVHDPDGRHVGFAKVTRDFSQRRQQEEELRASEERFRMLVDSVEAGAAGSDPEPQAVAVRTAATTRDRERMGDRRIRPSCPARPWPAPAHAVLS